VVNSAVQNFEDDRAIGRPQRAQSKAEQGKTTQEKKPKEKGKDEGGGSQPENPHSFE